MATITFTSAATQVEAKIPERGYVTGVTVNGNPYSFRQSGPDDLGIDLAPALAGGQAVVITYVPAPAQANNLEEVNAQLALKASAAAVVTLQVQMAAASGRLDGVESSILSLLTQMAASMGRLDTVEAILAAGGGTGGGGGTLPAAIPLNLLGARRLVDQAGFGSRDSDVASVMALGYAGWVDDQFTKTVADPMSPVVPEGQYPDPSENIQWLHRQAVGTDAQLRVRGIHALQNHYVTNVAKVAAYGATDTLRYAKIFNDNVFGNNRNLIFKIATSTVMTQWLTYFGSDAGAQPDENFARELPQLYGIGLWELNKDGSRKKKGQLSPSDPRYVAGNTTDDVETYTQADIRGLARVFTGIGPGHKFGDGIQDAQWHDMVFEVNSENAGFWDDHHEQGTKQFLGVTIPASTGALASVNIAVDTVFNHPSHAPFFCRRMIQELVTSNPSPAYIARVVAKYEDNGSGVRGDLKAMWKAILTDREARDPAIAAGSNFGRVRDPWVEMLGRVRTLVKLPLPAVVDLGLNLGSTVAHGPAWYQPSVFGYHKYDHASSNEVRALGLVDPEMEPIGENSALGHMSGSMSFAMGYLPSSRGDGTQFEMDFEQFYPLRSNVPALVDRLCELFRVEFSELRRQTLIDFVESFQVDSVSYQINAYNRTFWAVAGVITNAERMVQR